MEVKKKKISPIQIVIFIISFAVAYFTANYFFAKEDTNNEMLVQISAETNRTLPKMVDSETRFDSITIQGDTMCNHFTFINIPNDKVELDIDAAKSEMRALAQMNLDTSQVMKELRERNILLHYNFYDKEQKKVFEYTVQHKK